MESNQDLLRRIEQLEKSMAEAKRKQEEAERKQEEAERSLRATTLKEYLTVCHELVLSRIRLDTRDYFTTTVPTTNPARKHCPLRLTPWANFVSLQSKILKVIDKIVPAEDRLFETTSFLNGMGDRIAQHEVRGEPSLALVQNNAIEYPVHAIMTKLANYHAEQFDLAIPNTTDFQTTARNLRDPNDRRESVQRDARLLTDQICVARNASSSDIAYVIEYKAPYKLHTMHLQQGLRPMSIIDDVVNKPTIPTDKEERFTHYAELLSSAAVVQTYHYMIEAGLEYGYLTNGDAIVFLNIDWTNPTELHYHLALPSREVEVDQDPAWSNAVAQVLAFTVLALQSGQHSNNERTNAAKQCGKWIVDFSAAFHEIEEELEKREKAANASSTPITPGKKKHRPVPISPEWRPPPVKKSKRNPRQPSPPDESDRVLRSHNRRDEPDSGAGSSGVGGGGGLSGTGGNNSASGSSERGSGGSGGGNASGTGGNNRAGSGSPEAQKLENSICLKWPSRPKIEREKPREHYCTRACLMSLTKNRLLDSRCPNVALHRAGPCAVLDTARGDVKMARNAGSPGKRRHSKTEVAVQRHPVTHAQFMRLLQDQFRNGLEPGVVPLRLEGACGALFQVTLVAYGYTFIAKGVTGGRVPELEKEAAVYEQLRPLQGLGIPVCLGMVDLKPLEQVYYYDFDVRIIRFLLLSYGGTQIQVTDSRAKARIVKTVASIVDEMHSLGVAHGDIRLPNVLQGPDGEINVLDFDRAVFLPATANTATATSSDAMLNGKRALSAISRSKRQRLLEAAETDGSGWDTGESSTKGNHHSPGPPVPLTEEGLRARNALQQDNGNVQDLFALR